MKFSAWSTDHKYADSIQQISLLQLSNVLMIT